MWGASCEQECPVCLNGGLCDADSGQCVCRPGFKGTHCEIGNITYPVADPEGAHQARAPSKF